MNGNLYKNFVSALQNKVPKKSELVGQLTDLLLIERESVYRRLRGDVPFTLVEAMKVARNYGISLDVVSNSCGDHSPAYIELSMYRNDVDYDFMNELEDRIRRIGLEPDSEHGEALNSISPFLWPPYSELTRFYTFREMFQYSQSGSYVPFEDVIIPDKLRMIQRKFENSLNAYRKTFYILDRAVIETLIKDIRYFASIRLINRESVDRLKNELLLLLDNLETMAGSGKMKDTDNKFELYLSNVDIDMSYSAFSSTRMSCCGFLFFIARTSVTLNQETCENVRGWVNSLKKVSTLVTNAGEKDRIIFFDLQRNLIENL